MVISFLAQFGGSTNGARRAERLANEASNNGSSFLFTIPEVEVPSPPEADKVRELRPGASREHPIPQPEDLYQTRRYGEMSSSAIDFEIGPTLHSGSKPWSYQSLFIRPVPPSWMAPYPWIVQEYTKAWESFEEMNPSGSEEGLKRSALLFAAELERVYAPRVEAIEAAAKKHGMSYDPWHNFVLREDGIFALWDPVEDRMLTYAEYWNRTRMQGFAKKRVSVEGKDGRPVMSGTSGGSGAAESSLDKARRLLEEDAGLVEIRETLADNPFGTERSRLLALAIRREIGRIIGGERGPDSVGKVPVLATEALSLVRHAMSSTRSGTKEHEELFLLQAWFLERRGEMDGAAEIYHQLLMASGEVDVLRECIAAVRRLDHHAAVSGLPMRREWVLQFYLGMTRDPWRRNLFWRLRAEEAERENSVAYVRILIEWRREVFIKYYYAGPEASAARSEAMNETHQQIIAAFDFLEMTLGETEGRELTVDEVAAFEMFSGSLVYLLPQEQTRIEALARRMLEVLEPAHFQRREILHLLAQAHMATTGEEPELVAQARQRFQRLQPARIMSSRVLPRSLRVLALFDAPLDNALQYLPSVRVKAFAMSDTDENDWVVLYLLRQMLRQNPNHPEVRWLHVAVAHRFREQTAMIGHLLENEGISPEERAFVFLVYARALRNTVEPHDRSTPQTTRTLMRVLTDVQAPVLARLQAAEQLANLPTPPDLTSFFEEIEPQLRNEEEREAYWHIHFSIYKRASDKDDFEPTTLESCLRRRSALEGPSGPHHRQVNDAISDILLTFIRNRADRANWTAQTYRDWLRIFAQHRAQLAPEERGAVSEIIDVWLVPRLGLRCQPESNPTLKRELEDFKVTWNFHE